MRYLFVLLIYAYAISAQPYDMGKNEFSQRFQDLEKIKLLEILDMEEETAIKFFSRRNKMRKNIKSIFERGESIIEKMEISINESNDKSGLDKLISQSLKIEEEVYEERKEFIESLKEILKVDQIAKLILFEKKFKNDVRDLLIERGRRKFFKRNGKIHEN